MSRATMVELVEGEVATSTDVNGTLNSWNTSTSAGSLNGANVREEGLDRGALAQHVANTQRQSSTPQLTSAAAFAPGAFPAALDFGGATIIGPITVSTGDRLLICYTTWAFDANNSNVQTTLQWSNDNFAASINNLLDSRRRKRMRAGGLNPRATGTFACKYLWTTTGTYYFRVLVDGSAVATFRYSSFWVESLAT